MTAVAYMKAPSRTSGDAWVAVWCTPAPAGRADSSGRAASSQYPAMEIPAQSVVAVRRTGRRQGSRLVAQTWAPPISTPRGAWPHHLACGRAREPSASNPPGIRGVSRNRVLINRRAWTKSFGTPGMTMLGSCNGLQGGNGRPIRKPAQPGGAPRTLCHPQQPVRCDVQVPEPPGQMPLPCWSPGTCCGRPGNPQPFPRERRTGGIARRATIPPPAIRRSRAP